MRIGGKMLNPMILGLISLVILAAAFAFASFVTWTKTRTAADASGREVLGWAAKIELNTQTADAAKRLVETLEIEHYKRLVSRLEEMNSTLSEKIGKCKGDVAGLEVLVERLRKRAEADDKVEQRLLKKGAKILEEEILPAATPDVTYPAGNGAEVPPGRKFGTPPGR